MESIKKFVTQIFESNLLERLNVSGLKNIIVAFDIFQSDSFKSTGELIGKPVNVGGRDYCICKYLDDNRSIKYGIFDVTTGQWITSIYDEVTVINFKKTIQTELSEQLKFFNDNGGIDKFFMKAKILNK